MTLVSAAAGFGKSTALSAWLDQLAASSSSATIATAWLTLDSGDNQLRRFVSCVVAAVEEAFPRSCAPVAALLRENPGITVEGLADAWVDCLSRLPKRLVLVLDDLHTIDDAAVYALLARVVQFAPAPLHLVLSTRLDPLQLPLNRWRAQGWLNEVRMHDLSFTLDETAAFLEQELPSAPSPEIVAALYRYTEGWPVGVRLAALALSSHADHRAFLADLVANGNRFALDYLRDDVLHHQPEAVQAFLLQTAVLKRFCPALCAAVLQVDEGEAQQLLDAVERANLFLVDLSTPARWHRYHHQFQSMLLSKLNERYSREAIAELHRRAAIWLGANGYLGEATEYFVAIEDFEAALTMLEHQRAAMMNGGQTQELSDALMLIPKPLLDERPLLLLAAAWLESQQFEWASCMARVEQIESLLRRGFRGATDAEQRIIELEVVALRCALDHRLEGKVTMTEIRAAWTGAQSYLAQSRHLAIHALAEHCYFLGDIELSLSMIDATLEQAAGWPLSARCDLLNCKALLLFWNCDLQAAEQVLHLNLQLAQQHGLTPAVTLSWLILGVIAAARHRLDECERYLQGVLANPYGEHAASVLLATSRLIEVYAYQNRLDAVDRLIEQLREYVRPFSSRYLHAHLAALEAYVAMAHGDTSTALAWVLHGLNDGLTYHPMDRLPIIRARILVTEGSPASLHAACQILERYVRDMEQYHMRFYLVEGTSLLALALAGLGQMDRALEELSKALHLAVPIGMFGRILQRGQPMKRLLHAFIKHPRYAAQASQARLLLMAFPNEARDAAPPGVPLSDREYEVLRLMAEGLSNKAIAEQLAISVYTARNHTVNILAKLQVENRQKAVKRAQALGLLPAHNPPVVRQ